MGVMRTLLLAVFSFGLVAGPAGAENDKTFIATAIQTAPNTPPQSGKIYVSPEGTRFEFVEHGRKVVQIILPKQKIMRVLFPQEKVFLETQAPTDTPIVSSVPSSPCPAHAAMTCEKLSVDKFGDLNVERWSQSVQGVQGQSTFWWEPERRMIVRQEFPDGRIMQMNLVGEEDFNKRKTERWTISFAHPGQKVESGMRLIDTGLGIIVKEQSPSGMVRELKDIAVVKVDQKWFAVPAGFQQIKAPSHAAKPAQ